MNRVVIGDCREVLRTFDEASVQCVVTSPPYWSLRDYGVDGQLGLEATPEEYVATMVDVFREVRRVLRPDGALWLNLGDSYVTHPHGPDGENSADKKNPRVTRAHGRPNRLAGVPGLKHKDMVGIPWRVALALQADGWYLRCDVIWHKPAPMPESVTDRPTKAHEYVFLLAKSDKYFYDADAIKERTTGGSHTRGDGRNPKAGERGLTRGKQNDSFSGAVNGLVEWRNARSVWTIASSPYPGAHFATFPPELAQRCILAGSRVGDVVLDPFMGSGTVAMVAEQLGRRWLGCELNPDYLPLIQERTKQRGLFSMEAVANG